MQYARNVGPNLFACNENSAYIMPRVTTHAVMSCAHCVAHARRQVRHPYINVAHQKLLMDMLWVPAELYLSKFTSTHFSTLHTKIANQNVLKRIPIAMHNETETDFNKNLRICAEEPVASLSKR